MYDRLLIEAEALNIEIEEKYMPKRIKGLYGDYVIRMNKHLGTIREKTCVLAEELGHYHKSTGDILHVKSTKNMKQEILARRWAYDRLIPLHKLIEAYNFGCNSRYEIAGFLEVTEEFLQETLNYYIDKHGTEIIIENKYMITTDPLVITEI